MNKTIQKITYIVGNILGWLFTFVASYLISFIITGSLFSVYCTIVSFMNKFPEIIIKGYGRILLVSSIPMTLFLFFYMVHYAVSNRKTKGSSEASPDKTK